MVHGPQLPGRTTLCRAMVHARFPQGPWCTPVREPGQEAAPLYENGVWEAL